MKIVNLARDRSITLGSLLRCKGLWMFGRDDVPADALFIYMGRLRPDDRLIFPEREAIAVSDIRTSVGRDVVWTPRFGFIVGVSIDEMIDADEGFIWEVVYDAPEDLLG